MSRRRSFIENLQVAFRQQSGAPTSSRHSFRSAFSPDLAYGRHRGPARKQSRRAAVLIGLYQSDHDVNEWIIPLTLRPAFMEHHAGQICLPGGGLEVGETAKESAVREFTEELGVTPKVRRWLGPLSTQFVFGSDHIVEPWVAWLDPPTMPWQPDPTEVEQVIEMPVTLLADPTVRQHRVVHRGVGEVQRNVEGNESDSKSIGGIGFKMVIPGFRHGENLIWGATAMILDELAQLLH